MSKMTIVKTRIKISDLFKPDPDISKIREWIKEGERKLVEAQNKK